MGGFVFFVNISSMGGGGVCKVVGGVGLDD